MSSLMVIKSTVGTALSFTAHQMHISLEDGREVSIPLEWFPSLLKATPIQRETWRWIGDGEGIHWPLLDEDILIENLL